MTSTKKLTPIAAAELRHHVLKCSVPEPVRVALFEAIARQTEPAGGWAFVMISPERNDEVVAFCLSTERPKQTVRIWSYLLRHLRFDTGECDVTRSEIAETLGVAPRHVSASLMELARFGAIRKQRGRWYVNPDVAWRGSQSVREERARQVPTQLQLIDGGKP